jgi:hypothetical protein
MQRVLPIPALPFSTTLSFAPVYPKVSAKDSSNIARQQSEFVAAACLKKIELLGNSMFALKAKTKTIIPSHMFSALGPELLADAVKKGHRLSLNHLLSHVDTDGNLQCDLLTLPSFLECLAKMQSLESILDQLENQNTNSSAAR